MKICTAIVILASMLSSISAFADVQYDQEKNIVMINTDIQEGVDHGWIRIYNQKHIDIGGTAYDSATQKITGLCGKNPSLGLLILDGKLQIGGKQTPKVTGTNPYKGDTVTAADFVYSYVLKGDDAMDLIDLLLEYRQVGFAILSECPNIGDWKSGKIILNFDTRGLDRALNRIK